MPKRGVVYPMLAVSPSDSSSRALDRAGFLAIAAVSAGVLGVARSLVPDARGFGTHMQLGLPACAFQALTSFPCPGCGLTTAFAHMVRGELQSALAASPLGVLLCLLTLLSLPLSLVAAALRLPLHATFSRLRVDRVALALSAFALVQWLVRVSMIALR